MTNFELAESFIATVTNDELAYHLERLLDSGYSLEAIIGEYVAWQK